MAIEIQKSTVSNAEISIELDDQGVRRVLIFADSPDEQAAAHRLLALVAQPMHLLHLAIKRAQGWRGGE